MLKKNFSKLLIFAIIFALPAAAVSQSKKDIKKSKDLIEQGNKAFGQKDYRGAIDKYSESIALVQKNPTAHFWKGYTHYQLNEHDLAITELDIAQNQGYKPLDIYKVRWYVHSEKKNYDAALADIEQGLKIDPNNLMFLTAAGDINLARSSYQKALAAYEKAIFATRENADLYLSIAKVHYGMGKVSEQTYAAEEAIKRQTRFLGEAYFIAADGYQKKRRFPEAIDAYKRALAAKPGIYEGYRNLAEIYRSQNKFKDAIEISKKGLIQFPADGNIYTDISWYYSLADEHEKAIEAAKAGIQLMPNQHMAYTNLCRAYNDTKQYQEAITACNSALRLKPGDGETHFYLGRAYDLQGRAADATKHYGLALTGLIEFTKQNPDYSDGFYLLGNAYFANNRRDKAIEAYGKALKLSPRFAKARYNLGVIHLLESNKAAAQEQYNALYAIDADLAAKLKIEMDKP